MNVFQHGNKGAWWIAEKGLLIAGPFATKEQAETAKRLLEEGKRA